MNKIFKVIWSKSKQCYIVVSEIAKNKTGKKKIVVAGIFAALAMVNGVQDSQAINGSGARTGWNSNGVGFHPTQGLVVGPNMNDNTTIANGNVATVAIGAHSNASGSSSVAIGGAVVNGAGAIGLGWSTATGDNSVALGGTGSTNANGNNAFAASGGNASGESAIAIGSSAIAGGRGGVAVGWSAESAVNAVGIGFNAKAKANNTVAIGVQANNDNSIGDNSSSVSIGVKTRAREVGSMAMGVSADASGKYSIALGSGDVSGDYTATVNYPKATGEKAIAIGYNSNSSNERATAIGAGATASGTDSFAGVSGAAGGNSSIAIGKGASITAPTAGTTFGGQDSIAMGTGASANQHSSVTIGAGSTSDGVRNITIGPKASASGVDSIAIGNGGVGGDKNNTGVGGNGNTYTINVNDISTNVYYGTKSVDDGSIAFGNRANAAKGGLAIGTVSIADGGIAVGQSVLSKNGVAIGSAVSATAANAVAMGSKAEASSVGAVAIGGYSATDKTKAQGNNALAIGASAVTNGNETIAIGKSANASNANAVAVGKNAKASIANSVAIGSDSTTDTNATSQANTTINGITYNFAGATSDTGMQVSVGAVGKERQIKNVAAGEVSATSTDAINGSQLFAVASQIKPINYFSVKSSAVGNKNNDGATGTDAIAIGPGAQSSGNNGVSLGNGSQANAESVVSIGYQSNYGAQNNSKSIGIGWAAGFQSNGTENIGIGTDAGRKLTGSNNVSIGKSAGLGDVYTSGSVLLGQSTTIINSTDKSKINDVVAIGNGAQGGAASSVAIGKGAKALGFSTIAIGENSNAKVKVGSAPSVAIGRNTIANGDYAVALGGGDNSGQFQGAKAAGVGTTAIGAATVTKDNTNFQTAVGFGATTDATDASAFGHQAAAMAKNATALGSAASATAENATALGTGAIAQVKDGVAIGSGSKATVDKGVKGYDPNDGRTNKYGGLTNNILTSTNAAVSVGEGASVTRQITGVAAGTSNTDAVNVAQLKSVNLAFSGNSGNNDVNLANGTLAIKGDTTYITTTANKDGITIAGKTQDITVNTNGVASANKGMADAKNVAQSINDAISKNAYTWTVSANGDAGESVAKGNKVDFNGDSSNITVERAGKKITTKLNKDITVDSVKANNKVSVGATTKQLVLDGTTGVMTAGIGTNAIKLDGTSATITAGSGNNAISLNGTNAQAAFGTGTNAVSINGKTGAVTGQTFTAGNTTINTTGLTSGTGSSAVSFGTNGISAGNQAINNVATGGSTDSNAANIGDVKRYVSGATLNLTDGANNKGSVQLGGQSLKVSSGTGINATVSGQTVNIGLTTDAQNTISNGIGLLGNVGNTGIKQLKDGNATFDIKGDGSVVKTTASSSGVTIAVDTDKLAANTNLAYTANSASPAKTVSLSKGLNFVNGSNTIAIVNDDGKVSFDLNAATKNQINTNTTGVAANKANIATNAADIATNKNKIAANTTDIATNKGKIATNTTNIAANTTALARNISLGADSGTKSSQSLSTADVAFNVKGATGDFISTKMNGNTVEVSTKRAQIDSDANSGAASVTGADGLATAKNVADAINNAVTKSAYEWKLSANGEATTATVGKGDTVDFTGGSNITVERDNKNISVKLNKNLTNLSSVSIGNNIGETIKLDGSNGGITADHADFKDNTGAGTSIDSSGIKINNGIADLTHIGMGSISLDNGSGGNTVVTSSSVSLTDGSNLSEYNAKGIAFGDATGTNTAQFGLEGISAANQQIKDVATGTADTDAVNVKQLKDTVGEQKLNISDGTKDSSVALKNQTLTVTGTGAAKATVNGQTITIDVAEGTLTPNTTNGTVTATTGVAKATEVAAAINNTNTVLGNKIAKNAQDIATNTSNITANKNQITTNTTNIATNTANIAHTIALADDAGASTTAKSLKDGNVSFNIKGDNKFISTAASGNDVKLTVNEQAIKDAAKAASSFKVKANAHAEEEVKGGDTITFNNGDNIEISQAGKTFTIGTAKNITVDSVTAGNTVINTSGLTNGTTAITGTGITTDKVTVGGISIDKTAGINAGGKVISNVASGMVNNNATDDSNAANIGDVKQAVANLSQNLNITDGTNNGTVDLKNQKLNVAGANGVTATVNNQTITVGLDANTVNATTKGIGLTADTGSTGNKYLKDGDVSFAVTGDGNLVSTTGTTAGVKVAVDAAKVKDLAVAAVTVSKDAQADNPITVTPTAGANSKDYAIGIDTTKLAAKTDLTYRANSAVDANAKKVSLSKGLNFVDGGSTVATVDNDGKVSFDLNTATKNQINTNTTDIATNTAALARNISLGADSGTTSSQSLSKADVAFNVKGATGDFVSTNMNGNTVEISTKRATINSNATTGGASVTGNDGLATAQNVADAINKAADAAKAGAAWNITTNSSTTDKTAVKGGDTVDLVNGDNIEITQDGTDKKKITVATKKDITVDSVTANNKVTVGSGANKITLDGTDGSVTGKAFTGTTFTGTSFTGTSFTAGNTVINTNGLTNGTTAITGTGVTTDNVTVGGISIDKTAGINAGNKVISNVASGGTTLTNAANIGDVQNAVANLSQNLNITDGTNNGTVDLKNQKLNVAGANGVTAKVNNQTITVGLDADTVNATTKGIGLTADTGSTGNKYLKDGDVSFAVTGDGSLVSTSATAAGVKVAVNSASITAGADGTITGPTTDGVATAKNVADAINAAKKASKTEFTANTGEAANATTGNVTLTSTTAADGHTIYDVKLNDKVILGSGANAVTVDGTTGAITGKTATIGGVTVNGTANTIGGLSNTTWNGTAVSGRAATEDQLKAATGATTLKFTGDVAANTGSVNLKDDTFGIKGDNKYISTDVNGKNVNLIVSEAEVKKSAVAAVTVSTDTTDANNPLTVTPTTSADGTTKDYKVTIDGTKIANKTNLSYKANNGTAKQVSLADGLNFKNGTLTTASIDDNGVVKYDVNTASITAGTDGTITGPTTDGVATAKNVADAINAAKKASKTEITANTGEAANATTSNVTLTSTTAADGHTIYDVKLNDKVTLGSGANAVIIDGTTGAITGKTATIGGVTVNGTANTIGGLSNTTWNGAAVSGRAATEDQLKAATSATTLKFTGDVAANTGSVNLKDDTFGIKGDNKYISTDVNGKNVNLTVSEAEVKKSAVAAVTVSTDTTDANNPLTVTPTTSADGTTKDYKVTIDGTKIANKTNLSYKANNGTAKQVSLADGLNFKNGTLTTASIDDNGVVKYDVNTASITAGTDGTITGPTTDGVATAKNVADAINAAKKASKTELTANTGEAANATTGNVTLTSTTAADGHTIYDVKLNDKVTLGTGANAVTVDGTAAKVTAGVTTVDGATGTITSGGTNSIKVDGATGTVTGLTNKDWTPGVTKAVTGRAATEDQLQKVADAASSQTWNITADKAGTTGAQTGTKKNATVGKDETVELVAGDNLTINQDERKFTYSLNKDLAGLISVSVGTGTTETIKLDGATGKITAKNAVIGGVTVDGDNHHVTGLANTTWNGTATTGRAATEDQLKAVAETAKTTTDAVNLKFTGDTNTSPGVVNLKDDTLGVVGDGKYVSTDANGKNLTVKVSEAEVKKSAVAAVTVSTDTTDANNPLTVTPTTSADGTTKDYKVTIDGTKIANKTNLSYKANDGTAKQVSLADGLNFKNGTLTTASIDDNGVVKYDVNTASITAGADGTITGPTTDGVATAQNVANAINAAKKASKTEITANTGEAANATTGNVTLTSTTATDGHTIYDVKLNDKVTLGSGANAVTIDGTAGKATIGSSVINGVNNTFTTGGAKAVTLDGATGTITGTTANIGGVTVNGTANTIGGLSNTTWNGTATTGRAATEDQLKAVADAAGSQTWEITADKKAGTSGAQTGTKENAKVGKDDKVSLIAGENLTVDQVGKNFTYSLNTDLVKMNSATFLGTGTNTTVITGDSITQTAGTQTNTSTAAGNTVANGTKSTETTADGQVIKDGTKINTSTVDENTIVDGARSNKTTVDSNVIDDGNGNVNTSNATSNTITDGTNTSTITAGKATIGSSVIDGVNNTFTTGGANAVKLDGAAGIIKTGTVTVTGGTTNDITGLSNTTLSATDFATKGRAATEEQLKAATGATTLKFTGDVATNTGSVNLKDDTFGIKGDGKYISTDVNGKNVNLTVSEAEVKKSAVAAVTVSTDTTDANNPISVTPTTSADGTTKDYKVTIDGTKIANKTNLSYKANGGTAKQVSLADGLNFKNGTLTTASIDDAGVVKYDVNTASITAGADGTITGPTTDGVATAKNVADAINAAKKASKTEITANTGEAANSTKGNVTLTSTTAADGHTIYDVKLNDKVTLGSGANAVTIDGTAGKATIGSSIVDGVNSTFTTGGANAVKLDGAAGTIKTGTVTVTGGTTNDITGLSNTTVTSADFATKGRAATEEQLKAVGEQTWQITADKDATTSGAQTGTKKNAKVGKDDKVQLIAGENLTVNQNERDFTYSLNKDLVKMNSATFEATGGRTTVIKGDSIVQTDGTKVNTSTAGGSTVADGTKSTETTADGQVIKDGAKSNKSTVDSNVIDDGNGNVNTSNATSNTITDGTNTSTVTAGKAQIGTVGIDGVASKITTGGANVVVINGADGTVKTGTVTVIGGTTNDITGLSNTTVTAADFATKGRAATEEQLKAVGEQTWQITADKDATTSGAQTGTKKDAKVGKDDKVQLIAGENMTVNQNERDFTYSLNKDLVKMNSATFEATGGKTTVIKGDSIVQTDGTKVNTSTAAGNTVVDGAKSTATTADGTTVTTANGNTNYAADGVRINTTGKTPVSLTDAGLDNGNNVIKNVASGHVNNDATDNTNAANIADVKKATTTVTANAGEAANATTGNVTLTSTTAADGHTIYDVKLNDKVTLGSGANAVMIDGTAGKATFGSSVVDGVNNTFTTGGANAVKLDGVAGTIKTGTVTVTGGTTNDITGLSNTTVTAADFATKGRAATEEQLKAVGEQTWQITADKDVTTSGAQTGTKKDAKVGKDDKVQLIAGENMTVNQNERDFTYSLNKDLVKMNSATFEATGGKTTVIKGDSIVQTDGNKTNTATASGNTVANGTKSTETTAAGQVIKDGAKSNKSTVDSNVIDAGNGNVNTSNATSNTITDGTNTSTITAGKATIGSSIVDGVNNTFTTGGANAVKLDGVAGTIKTGTVTVTGGTTNDITGLSNTTVTGADFATKGRAATEEQLKAVGEQTWQITADKDATTSGAQTGTKKDAKVGKDDKVQLIAGENLTVNQNERDFTYSLNKDLVKMNSATFEATGGKTTVIKGDSIVQTDGTKVNTSTAAGNTVVDGAKSTATTADGTTVTTANGNTKYAADGVRINTTGKNPVSLTDEGLDNGNNVIKNVASGHVNNDATDNTNAANIADVKKATTTVTANAGEAANATKGNVTLTSTTAADGHTIYDVKLNDKVTLGTGANAVTIDGTAGKATIGSSVIDGVNNTFTTGGTNAVKLDGAGGTIKTGTVTVTGGTTNDITGLSNTTVNSADFATKGRAATEEQLKAVGEQTWQITADKDATTSGAQTGTKKDAKVGKDDKVQLIAGENMTVNQNERDFTFTLNKDLVKMNSATFLGTGSNTTVITGNSITQTAGTQTNTSTAGGNTVADGTKSTETTAAGQVIKDGAKTNTSTVDENTLVDGAKSNKSTVDGNTITDGTNTTETTSSSVTVKDNAGNSTVITKDNITTGVGANKITLDGTAGKATIGSSVVDGVNNTFTTGGANAVKLDGAAGTIKTGTVTVTGGTTNDITGLSNTTVTSADFATKGRAATEEQLKAVGEQTWQITADKDATTSGAQTGTKKDAKVGKDDKVQLIAGENMTVNQNERDFTFTLNKDLVKMNSATFLGTGSNTTVITGNSITQTAGTQTNTSTAGGNTVADGTKSTETTAAGQVIKDGAKSNKSTVDNNVIDDGNGNVNTSNATSNTITDGTNTTATTSSSVTVKDNAGNSTVITKDNITTGVGANKITLDGTAGKATVGASVIDGVNNTFTTGGANAVKLDGVAGTIKTGTVTVTGGTTNDITGLSNTTVTAADFATKGRAATEEQLKAVGEQTWQITADKDVTTSGAQTGTKKDAKVGKDDKVQLIAGENMTVNQNERDFTFTLNKDLVKMNSATFEATGGKTTVIKGDSIVQTDGTKVNTSTAGGNTVADGTKSTETTADGQVIKDGTKTNTSTVDENTLVDGAKSNKATVDSNVVDDGNGNVNTSNATSNTITDGTNRSTITAGKATIGSSVIDGVNNTFTTGGANAVKLDGAAGTIRTGTVTVTGGTTNDITGLSNTTVTSADFATKGRAATEEQLKAVGEQTWQITADKDATTSGAQTGTKKDAKVGKDDKVQLIAGENMTVNQNERDFTFTLNKDLVKMNSATFLGTGSNTTVITGNSITQTAGTQTNTSTAGGNTVADGTKSTETTAAGQVIKDGAKSNKSTVDNNVIDDGNGNVNTSNATSNTITDGTNTTATTSSSVTVKDNAGNSTVITKDNITTGVGGNKITLDGTAGKATVGASVVDGVNNTFTTGGANAVKLDGAAGTIKTGTVTVTGGTTNDITGLSNTTVTAADFATKGRAATEEQLKAVGEQTWQITADKDATTSGAQTGTKKDAKVGKDDKVQLIAGENMTVNQNERDFTFTLNKDLVKMNSATFEATGGKTTIIKGDSIVQTDGTKVNTSTAGGNTVANGTKSTETTADGQVIKDGAKSNKSTVSSNVIDDGTGNVNTSNATSNTITDGTNTTATTSSSVTVKDNAGNSTVITKDNITTGVGGNKITLDGTAGKATVGASVVDGVNNTFTTGGANAVKLDGAAGTIKTGTVTVTGGTTNDITGLSNTTVNSADFATKGRAATEEQLKAVGEQTWQITADKDATTSGAQTGTKKDAKVGKDDKVQLIAGENMTVNQNERDFTFTLNKDLVKMNSATFLGTGSNTTVITGNSITQTAGTQTNTSTAGGNTVADGTKSTETTAAGQVIKDGAKSNKSTVDSNVIDAGNGNVNTSNATSNTITDGTNTSTITAGKATIGSSIVDGVNNTFTTGGANAVKLDGVAGTIKTGTVTVTGGTTNDITGLSNTTVTAADFATKGRAATEEQLKAVGEQTWQITADKDATTSGAQTGTKKDAKVGKDDKVQLIAGENMTVNQNERDFTFTLNKDLVKMNSATFEATGGKTTVIKGDSIVQIDGGKTNTSNAAGNTVVDGNKSTSTTAAGTTITDGAKTNTSTTDKNVINDGAGNTNTATATSNNLADNAGNSNVSNATSNTLKNAAGDETKADAKGVTVKDAAGNNATFTKDGITITKTGKDTVSLTSDGLDNGKNKIVNVAAGVANTDAVNVGQLKEYAAKSTTELTANNGETAGSTTGNIVLTKTTAADGHTIYDNKLNDKITLGTDPTKAVAVDGTTGTVTGLTNKTWTPGSIVSGRAATEDQLKEAVADSGWKAAVDKEGSGQSTVVGTSPEKIKAEETVTFKAGNNMMVTQTGKSISYAVNPELTNMTSATFKDAAGNTTVTNGNGITITPGSANPTNPHAGPVSLTKDGLNNGNNQIKGVAPGTDPTDAVNVSQLNASNANTSQAINQIAGEVQHVGAHAAAMAALKPIQYDPLEPTQVMAGVGNYRGETAAALGLAHYTNENTMFNVGVSVGGNHNMVNAGVTHKFGYSPEKKNIPDRYKAGPISSVYVMQDEVSSLKKENAEQKYVIADQAARLTTLEAENEQQRRELAETKKGLDDLKAAVDKLLASKG